ncbi:50S ribosomal protein L24 [Methylocaldum marinum]|uniref:Large ribosomal subunit protein uL24 n=1 Tax=Methylocaldum marinum TaxID=1432792 RepID=A0A250KSJ0_9GAMM|nr:50S ribosomal protein L24 [Methylocaldum marinum]BBA34653.1 50S ribosomal protein L24 [Methylocaldum marinum]
MRKIKKGDQVVVLTGKDKGKRGAVISVSADDRIIVEGVNLVRKHQRPIPMRGVNGGIIEKAMPIHRSNVALYNPAINKADKVGFRLLADGRKVRYFKSTNEVIDV